MSWMQTRCISCKCVSMQLLIKREHLPPAGHKSPSLPWASIAAPDKLHFPGMRTPFTVHSLYRSIDWEMWSDQPSTDLMLKRFRWIEQKGIIWNLLQIFRWCFNCCRDSWESSAWSASLIMFTRTLSVSQSCLLTNNACNLRLVLLTHMLIRSRSQFLSFGFCTRRQRTGVESGRQYKTTLIAEIIKQFTEHSELFFSQRESESKLNQKDALQGMWTKWARLKEKQINSMLKHSFHF